MQYCSQITVKLYCILYIPARVALYVCQCSVTQSSYRILQCSVSDFSAVKYSNMQHGVELCTGLQKDGNGGPMCDFGSNFGLAS